MLGDLVRYMVVILSALSMVVLYMTGQKKWELYTVKMKNLYMALATWSFAATGRNIQSLLNNVGPNGWTWVTLLALAFTITGLTKEGPYFRDTPTKPPSTS